MRRLFYLPVLLLLSVMTAGAQVPDSSQSGQPTSSSSAESATPPESGETPTTPAIKPGVTITGKRPPAERPLPKLPPNEFTDCLKQVGADSPTHFDYLQAIICEHTLNWEKRIVVEACTNRSGNTAPPRAIQACTELLNRNIFEHWLWFFVYANRAAAYFAQGDKQHALDDYNEAVNLAPHNADLHYNRGVFYEAQFDADAALRDFNTAIAIDSKHVPALRQRAKLYQARGNFSLARSDYSEAIGLQPKTAALWSERGYVCLRQHDVESAARDEATAIQLDPKLARAYFLRGVAFGDLGDSGNASSDIKTAVDLDPSLARYVTIKGKSASVTLPP
jgi:tetratricopeptide (TPR) repeat protein